MESSPLNYWYRTALATLAASALLLSTRTSLAQADLAAQSRDAANYVNQVRANPAGFAKLGASLADADVEARAPLLWSAALQRAAERHAKHMADTSEWGHFMTINGQKVGMNQWMREAGYSLVDWLRNDDTNFECIHWENGFDLSTLGRRTIDGFLAEGKDGGHVRPLIGRTDFYKACKHIGVGMATDANGKTYVSVLVGIYDPQNPSAQPPGQPADPTPAPAPALPALPQAPRVQQFQKGADVGGGAFTSSASGNGPTQWVETSDKDPNFKASFEEKKRDKDWIYLLDAGRNMTVILPLAGGMSHLSQDGGQTWTKLYSLTAGAAASPGAAAINFPTPPFSTAAYPMAPVSLRSSAEWAVNVLGNKDWTLREYGRFNANDGSMESVEGRIKAEGPTNALACVSYICVSGPGAPLVDIGVYPATVAGLRKYQGWQGDHFEEGPAVSSNGQYWYRLEVQWKAPVPGQDPNSVLYAGTYRHEGNAPPPSFKLWSFKQVPQI